MRNAPGTIWGGFVGAVACGWIAATGGAGIGVAHAAPATAAVDAAAAARAKLVVDVLAADGLKGRGNGTSELNRARDLVRGWMREAGITDVTLQSFEGPGGAVLDNVVGKIPGAGTQWVVVGAHYDGLGVGAEGEHAGRVFPGADDNASGVAALLRVAARVADEAADGPLARGVAFVAFAGEEIGLLGSRAFVASPPVPLEKTRLMLNFDTVGRPEANRLVVFGSGTADELPDVLRGVNYGFGFDLALNSEGAGASDHTPFFEKGVPVLHFFSGANADYHRPTDTPEKVDSEAIVRIADFAAELAVHCAVTEAPLTFRPAGAENIAARTGGAPRRRVSLGTIPDFARERGGILLQGVMPGSAAEDAGLQTGDVVIGLGDAAIDTIDDYQAALAAHAPGDTVAVKYVRAGEEKAAKVVLRERK